ncbi:MAG TPA: flagellar basal body P-ring formation chaperone FlgA [Bryobacteraceae bacterium]|nr:flagellar basal body P-ring formation chaperone FlgA [Bryobacteraceae bacterium]
MKLLVQCLAGSLAWGGCVAVEADRIRAADLARAVPAFAAAPPEAELGYAPAPGARRYVRASELARWGVRLGVRLPQPASVCFERRIEALNGEQVRAAMEHALKDPQVRIEVMEWSRQPVPAGTLEFPISGLARPPVSDGAAPVLWKGWVRYGSSRRYPVWARVRVRSNGVRVVAAVPLKPGQLIRNDDVRLEEYEGFPDRGAWFASIEEVSGRLLRQAVAAGAPLPRQAVEDAPEIARGATVRVEAASGAARVVLEGRAESDGRLGELVRVRNLATGRTFRARVEGPGRAVAPAAGLADRRTP